MENQKRQAMSTKNLVMYAVLAAITFILQYLGAFIKFGPFSISLVLVPIAIGAALLGWKGGAFLGFVFGWAVLASGDAAAFLAVNVPGTITTVLVKGTVAGLVTGIVFNLINKLLNKHSARQVKLLKSKGLSEQDESIVYDFLSRNNIYIAVFVSAIVCPVVNTGVFLIGCLLFFMETIAGWAQALGFESTGSYIIFGLVGGNFLFEVLINIILAPAVVRLLKIRKSNK